MTSDSSSVNSPIQPSAHVLYVPCGAQRPVWKIRSQVWEIGFALLLLGVFVSLATMLPSMRIDIFDSPDETSNYIFTSLAESGELWYTKEYTSLDAENLLHPRGALTQGARVVPYSFLGLPVIYAPDEQAVGGNLQLIAVALAFTSAWGALSLDTSPNGR